MAALVETNNEKQFDLASLVKWDKIRYFSFKNRKRYPNLFFYYFNQEGKVNKEFTSQEKNKILSLVTKDPKLYNGLWGYFSLIFNNKNGLEIYKYFSKLQLFSCSNSLPCIQDGKPFNEEIKVIFKLEILNFIKGNCRGSVCKEREVIFRYRKEVR